MPGVEAARPGDPRFYVRSGPFPLSRVAAAAGSTASGEERLLHGVAPLQTAGPREVSFLDNRRYLEALAATRAGAVVLRPEFVTRIPAGTAAIAVPEPYQAWARVAALFHPPRPARPGIHPSAVIGEGAMIDPSAEIGPLVVVGAGAEIGAGCRIGPGAVIGESVVLGAGCRIGALVSLSHALLGPRVSVYPGARIGQEGFGFAVTEEGFVSVPQLGRVVLEHDVEIGANCTIDRGSVQDTVIGAGTRLDNLVQIGHNVRLGRLCVIVSQVGISGSTVIEDFVMIGGQAGLVGHLHIGRKARIGAQSGVRADVPTGADVVGSPAEPKRSFFRQVALLRRLAAEESGGRSPPGRQAK
ncbi:MAG: UDP-3-O-(3-hydroxymyristoyl)glucosamine N-acyltransferase [Rhodospirillales bacterium]|nr:UDP-3-O-(3-hydroxymyristoyl)glucosamine N-acyltransferase [Rhodospirillales bacterium]